MHLNEVTVASDHAPAKQTALGCAAVEDGVEVSPVLLDADLRVTIAVDQQEQPFREVVFSAEQPQRRPELLESHILSVADIREVLPNLLEVGLVETQG